MKSILALAALAVFLVGAFLIHRALKEDKNAQTVIGWSNSLVWSAVGTEIAPAFSNSEIQPGSEPRTWSIVGEIAYRLDDGSAVRGPYEATIEQVCSARTSHACWRLARLMVDGGTVDLTPKALVEEAGDSTSKEAGSDDQAGQDGMSAVESEENGPSGEGTGSVSPQAVTQEPEPAPAAAIPEPIDEETLIFQIQGYLGALGLDVGRPDGKIGPKTRAAIRAHQERNGLLVDGNPSLELLRHLEAP